VLIEQPSKDLITDAASVLTLVTARYQAKHGEIPREESLSLPRVEQLDQADAEMLAIGLETLALEAAQEQCGTFPPITQSKPAQATLVRTLHAWQVIDSMLV
jgi:hypothetical protein